MENLRVESVLRLSGKVIESLGYYVYLYVDPRDGAVFYVGKGTGSRCLSHLLDTTETEKTRRIAAIRDSGAEPGIDILVHALPDEATALRVEAAVIDLIGKDSLTNLTRGWRSISFGRMALTDLVAIYDPLKAEIKEPAILIRINQLFRYAMTPIELYDATRGVWRIGPNREKAKYAFAVYQGIVREAYRITGWFPAGTTFSTRDAHGVYAADRWEFVGVVAEEEVRGRYINLSVEHYFPRNTQSPFIYVNMGGP